MKQQINLYQDEFHEKVVAFPAKQMLIVVACSLFLIFLGNALLVLANQLMSDKYHELLTESNLLKKENQRLQGDLDAQKVDVKLRQAVTEKENQLRARQNIMRLVENSEGNEMQPFSDLLSGLGRQHIKGMWLSHIDIRQSGKELYLEGSTISAKLLPEFISRLNAESAYLGREFRKIVMKRNEENIAIIDFVLSTSLKDEEES